MTHLDSSAVNKRAVINNRRPAARTRLQCVNILREKSADCKRSRGEREREGWALVSWNEACVYGFFGEGWSRLFGLCVFSIPRIFHWLCCGKVFWRKMGFVTWDVFIMCQSSELSEGRREGPLLWTKSRHITSSTSAGTCFIRTFVWFIFALIRARVVIHEKTEGFISICAIKQ